MFDSSPVGFGCRGLLGASLSSGGLLRHDIFDGIDPALYP